MHRWAQIAPVFPGKPALVRWIRYWVFILLEVLWPLEMANTFPLQRASTVLRLGSRGLSCRLCRPGLFGQLSENTTSAYVSGHSYGRTDLQTMSRNLRDLKRGECEATAQFLSLDIVSLMVVEFLGDFMGNGRVVLSGGLAPS